MDIECTFQNVGSVTIGPRYSCSVTSAIITAQTKVNSFIGNHQAGKTNQDVEVLYIHSNPNIHFFPRGISKIFPNLVGIWIYNSGLKEISADDFLSLEHLREIWLHGNKLTTLPRNLLRNTKKLEYFRLNDQNLKGIELRMFNTISQHQWKQISMFKTVEILYEPGSGKGLNSLKEFKSAIKASFLLKESSFDRLKKSSAEVAKTLWQQKKFSDFSIIAGSETFSVHKVVLAARSPVFAKMLETDEDVKATNKLEIKDCSEETVEEFLQCLYTGEIDEERERNALDLFSLASTFEVPELKAVSEQLVLESIQKKNALQALNLGNLYNSEEIIEAAFDMIKEIFPKFEFSDSLKFSPDGMKEFVELAQKFQDSVEQLTESLRKHEL